MLVATKVPSQIDLLKYAIKHSFGHRVDELKDLVVVPPINGDELPQAEIVKKKQSDDKKSSSINTTTKKSTLKGVRKTTTRSKKQQ